MPTQGHDYARRFLEWQKQEAAARTPSGRIAVRAAARGMLDLSEYDRLAAIGVTCALRSRPAARCVLQAHYEASRRGIRIPWKREQWDYLNNTVGDNDNDRAYREWVRVRLRQSGIAQLLPGGRSALPDIHEQLPQVWRTIERLLEPRSYPQLVSHLVKYLDWYLEPTHDVPPPAFPLPTWILLVFAGLAGFFGPMTIGLGYLVSAAAFVAYAALTAGRRPNGRRRIHNFYSAASLINSAELFYYLLESYAEPEELKSAEQ